MSYETSSVATPTGRGFDPLHPLNHVGRTAFLAIVLVVLVVVYYSTRYDSGPLLVSTLLQANPGIVLAILAVDSLYLICQGGVLGGVYRAIGIGRALSYSTCMYLGMNLVNTIVPVVGLSGSVFMMHFEKERGLHRSHTALINFLYYVIDYLVFLGVAVAILTYLIIIGRSSHFIATTSILFGCVVLGALGIGTALFTHPDALGRVIHSINRALTWVLRRHEPLIRELSVSRFANGALQAWKQMNIGRRYLSLSVLCAVLLHVACLSMLWLSFYTFHVRVDLRVLVSGYTVATLLTIVSPTPGGIGVAEGGMTAVFVALGVPVEQALLVTLLYRTIFVWYPLALGFGALHVLPRLADKQATIGV